MASAVEDRRRPVSTAPLPLPLVAPPDSHLTPTVPTLARPPKSTRRPKSSPLSSPNPPTSPQLASPSPPAPSPSTLPLAQESGQADHLAPPVPSLPSPAQPAPTPPSAQAKRTAPRFLAPPMSSVHPRFYDSTASTTEDDDADSEREEQAREASVASLVSERRRLREEARATARRSKGSRSPRSMMAPSSSASKAASTVVPARKREIPLTGWEEKYRQKMPVVEGRDGLGFVIEGLGAADCDGIAEASPAHGRTYTSSLGSGISNASSPTGSPSLVHPTQRLAVTEQPAVSFDSPQTSRTASPHAHFHLPTNAESRVRFEQPRKSPREWSSSSNSYVDLQPEHIVFDFPSATSSPAIDYRRTSTAASLFSNRTAPFSSPATSAAPSPRHGSPAFSAPRARSPRLPAGPSTMAGESLASRNGAPPKLYFPPAPPKSVEQKLRNPSLGSPVSLVFPSRPQQKPTARTAPSPRIEKVYFPSPPASTSASPVIPSARPRQSPIPSANAGPFPTRTQPRSTPSTPHIASVPTSPASLHSGPFPPSPVSSPHARFLGRPGASYQLSKQPSFTTVADLPISPSYASAFSTISVAEPVFPTLHAKLEPDGIVRAGVANRRVSKAPWEAGGSDGSGDELDRMMRAQRREDADRQAAKEREHRRKSIHAELLKPVAIPPSLADLALLPASPAREQDEAFHRVLLESETVKRSLGSALMSDSLSTRRPSPIYEDPPALPRDEVGSETAVSAENGMTPSSSTSSEISLPSFPDVPHHSQQLYFPPPPKAALHRIPAHGGWSDGDGLETLEEEAMEAHTAAKEAAGRYRPNGLVGVVDFAATSSEPIQTSAAPLPHRLSVVSDSGMSQYADAHEEVPDSPRGVQEVPIPPIAVEEDEKPPAWLSRLATGQWVLETAQRSLGDIGEEEEPEVEAIRHSRLFSSVSTAESAPFTPLISSFPQIPQTSPARSAGHTPRQREVSAGSAITVPPSPSHRAVSPAPSATSRSSANSSAAVSYTLPRRNAPTSSGFVKPKLTLGKKLGSLFSSTGSGSSTASGISSRDIVLPAAPSGMEDDPFAPAIPSPASQKNGFDWDSRTNRSFSAASHHTSSRRTTPPSASVASSANGHETEKEGGKAPPSAKDAGLNDLLSRFEREEKERIRIIAQAKRQQQQHAVPVSAPAVSVA
ncbi:hypothetical protein JCM8547_007833 [Rhodosporidiobolus lusitaniae]